MTLFLSEVLTALYTYLFMFHTMNREGHGLFTDRQFADTQFTDSRFTDKTVHRQASSPTGQFTDT